MSIVGFLRVPTNRHFVYMIISIVVAISGFASAIIIHDTQNIARQESKLNQILEAADDPKNNITVYVIPPPNSSSELGNQSINKIMFIDSL